MANNTIKGLTVEIGGDTTKLGKALENVEKKTRDISGELREVDKLLKLDPGNTELLAQKQKLLAEAVDSAADKLKTLKEAEKQVQKQFKKGEVSEEQVRALQREIVKTEKEMEDYEKAIKGTTKSMDKLDDSTEKAEKETKGLGTAAVAVGTAGNRGAGARSSGCARDVATDPSGGFGREAVAEQRAAC